MAETELLGVYGTDEEAREVARALEDVGVAPDAIRVGAEEDVLESLRVEMDDEVDESWTSGLGMLTKEMTRGALVLTPIAAVIGALVLLPVGFVSWGGTALWIRLLVCAGIGFVVGATVGMVIGGGFGSATVADAPLEAEHGVPVRVRDARADVQRVMRDHAPLRLDVLVDGERRTTVTTEEDQRPGGAVEYVREQLHRRDGSG